VDFSSLELELAAVLERLSNLLSRQAQKSGICSMNSSKSGWLRSGGVAAACSVSENWVEGAHCSTTRQS